MRIRNVPIFLLGIFVSIFLASCGGSTDPAGAASPLSSTYSSGSNDPGTTLSTKSAVGSETKVLDSVTTSQIVSTDPTSLVFQGAPETVKNLKPGAIVIIENIARKVEGVYSLDDKTYVRTSEPEFSQVIDKLEINGDIDLTEAHLIPESVPKGVVIKQTNKSLAKITTGKQGNTFAITITDHVVYDNDGKLSTTWDQVLANGKIELTKPNIKFEYYYGVFHDKYAEMKFTAGEKVNLQLSSKNFKFEKTYKVPLGKFVVPVPVTGGVANLTIDLILVFDAKGSARIVAGFSGGAFIDQGIKATLNPYKLTTSNNTTFAFNLQEPTFEGNVSASIGINPNISLRLFQYDMTGINNNLALGANASVTATISKACAQLVADAVLSSTGYIMLPKASFDIDFSWDNFKLSADISMVKQEKEIFSAKKNFYDSGLLCASSAAWSQISTEGSSAFSSVSSIVIDSSNSQILYAGIFQGGGIFKSTNGGSSWITINNGLGNTTIGSLAIDPKNSQILYAGTWGGVYKSSNGGISWAAINNGISTLNAIVVDSLSIDSTNSQIIYAGTRGGIFKSTNGGMSWTPINNGFDNAISAKRFSVNSIAIDPINNHILYIDTNADSGYCLSKSTDGGLSWTTNNLPSGGIISIIIDPTNSQSIYVATYMAGIFKSTDSGISWTAINSGLTSLDIRALAVAPSNRQILYVETFDGIFKSSNGGANWTFINNGLPGSILDGSLSVDPINSQIVYAGIFQGGLWKSTSGGQ